MIEASRMLGPRPRFEAVVTVYEDDTLTFQTRDFAAPIAPQLIHDVFRQLSVAALRKVTAVERLFRSPMLPDPG